MLNIQFECLLGVLDVLQGVVYTNDNVVDRLHLFKCVSGLPGCVVTITDKVGET
jgi:hypothetical protein